MKEDDKVNDKAGIVILVVTIVIIFVYFAGMFWLGVFE